MAARKLGIFSDPLLDRQLGEIVREFTPEDWIAPELLNGWAHYGGVYSNAGYYKHLNRVYFRGLIKSGAQSTQAFTLPPGYRPAKYELIGTTLYVGGSYESGAVQVVPSTGAVSLYWTAAGTLSWLSLDGLSFRVAS